MSATDTAAVRNEQALRADTFAALGVVEVIAHEASATAIAARIDATLAAPPPRPRAAPVLRLDGLDNAAAALGRLLRADSSSPAPDLAL
jgi:predicted glycosyltransferase